MPNSATGPPATSAGSPALPSDEEHAAVAVRRRRLELGWTQEQLAERSGVSAATVRKVEAAAQPHYRELTCTRLCTALGWPPEALDVLRPPTRRNGTAANPTAGSPASGILTAIDRTTAPANGGPPRAAELAALTGRLSRLDERQWERLVAFVDGLTATDT